jgi:hypothetical protein
MGMRFKQEFKYNPETGEFRGRSGKKLVASKVRVDGDHMPKTSLIWFIMTGRWPQNRIDHIDRNRHNNKWSNLREVTASQNSLNRIRINGNGFPGVHKVREGTYQVRINNAEGIRVHVGTYATAEIAAGAYKEASRKFHGEFSPFRP